MLATIFAYFWHFASVLHVSFKRLDNSEDQADTHSSISGQGPAQSPDRDTTVICSTNAEKQGHSGKPCADFCTPHSPRRSLFCVERGRSRALRNERVGIYYALRTATGGLLCLLLECAFVYTMMKQDAKSNREMDDRINFALCLYQRSAI